MGAVIGLYRAENATSETPSRLAVPQRSLMPAYQLVPMLSIDPITKQIAPVDYGTGSTDPAVLPNLDGVSDVAVSTVQPNNSTHRQYKANGFQRHDKDLVDSVSTMCPTAVLINGNGDRLMTV